jgi:hypothetical protein
MVEVLRKRDKSTRRRANNDVTESVITSPYVMKSRNLSFLLRQANPPLSLKYQERFTPVAHSVVKSIYRVVHGGDQTEVYETVGPGVVFTSFLSGSLGLACTAIVEMSLTYGEPTLLYEDEREGYSELLTAEWWPERFLSELPKRVAQHLTMYTTKTVHMREVERQAEKYLSRGNSGSRSLWHELADDEIDAKLDELNGRLKEHGYRTRFKVDVDEFGWDVIVDDGGGKPELVETVEEAENIVEELLGGG